MQSILNSTQLNLKYQLSYEAKSCEAVQIWIISYKLHIISLLTGDMNSINWPRSQCVAVEHRTGIAEVTGSNPVEALIFSGFFFPIA